jgi:hypothetical protein
MELSNWRRLYESAVKTKKLAPWEWMSETDVFGIEDPESGKIGLVSVMGALGEHFSVALYRDIEAFYHMRRLTPDDMRNDPAQVLHVPHLQAAFEDRGFVEAQDQRIIKELGLKFRGRNAWPVFRSYRPGYHPWYLESEEVLRLSIALEQLLDVAPRFLENPSLLPSSEKDRYLVRRLNREGRERWEDISVLIPEPPPVRPVAPPIPSNVGTLKRLPRKKKTVEVDFSSFPVIIGKKGDRPRLPYLFLAVEGQNGLVLGFDIMEVTSGMEAALERVPARVAGIFLEQGFLPAEIRIKSQLLCDALEGLGQELKIGLKRVSLLKRLDAARASLDQHLSRG